VFRQGVGVTLQKILVPTDLSVASEDAVAAGAALAAQCRAKLTLLHVRHDAGTSTDAVRARLRELTKHARGVLARSVILESKGVWQAICDYARDHEYDLISITRRSHPDPARSLGGVTERVLQLAPCRVLIAGVQVPPSTLSRP